MRVPALTVLREREFRLLIGARLVSQLGNQITVTVLAFAVLDVRGRASDVGLVLGAEGFALGAVLLLGGVVGDRAPRRRIMVTADLVRSHSFDWLGAYVFNPVGYALAGPLAVLAGAGTTLRGAAAVAFAAVVTVALVPDVRGFTTSASGAEGVRAGGGDGRVAAPGP